MTDLEKSIVELRNAYVRATAEALKFVDARGKLDQGSMIAVIELDSAKKHFGDTMYQIALRDVERHGFDPKKILARMDAGEHPRTIRPEECLADKKEENVINGKGAEIVNLDERRKK